MITTATPWVDHLRKLSVLVLKNQWVSAILSDDCYQEGFFAFDNISIFRLHDKIWGGLFGWPPMWYIWRKLLLVQVWFLFWWMNLKLLDLDWITFAELAPGSWSGITALMTDITQYTERCVTPTFFLHQLLKGNNVMEFWIMFLSTINFFFSHATTMCVVWEESPTTGAIPIPRKTGTIAHPGISWRDLSNFNKRCLWFSFLFRC